MSSQTKYTRTSRQRRKNGLSAEFDGTPIIKASNRSHLKIVQTIHTIMEQDRYAWIRAYETDAVQMKLVETTTELHKNLGGEKERGTWYK